MKRLALALVLLAGGCGSNVEHPPLPGPDAVSAEPTPPPDCSQAVPQPLVPGATLAFLATDGDHVRTYAVEASGCWVLLDETAGFERAVDLEAHPNGRFLYESGQSSKSHTGVRVFAIDGVKGRLQWLEDDELQEYAFGVPQDIALVGDTLYAIVGGIGTGYHGGFWQFAVDAGTGGLSWQGKAFRNREPFALKGLRPRSMVYVWTEDAEGAFYSAIRALRADGGGRLAMVNQVRTDWGHIEVGADGRFLWLATSLTAAGDYATLDAYRIGDEGGLELASSTPWGRQPPVAHPSGRVLYAQGAGTLESYRVDPVRGAPVLAASVPYQPAPSTLAYQKSLALAPDPSGEWLFAVTAEETRAYRTNAEGALVERGRAGEGGYEPTFVRVP